MIRRDDRSDWLLIPQVDHARLAGRIAEAWGNERVPPLPLAELLVSAIDNHDDGWLDWARAPQIDPGTGRPRNFTEMRMHDASELWTNSIEICGRQHPLSGIWVSKHFCHLASAAREHRIDDAAQRSAIDRFLDDQQQRQQQWKLTAAAEFPNEDLDRLIETGFRYIQFFDRISLWLCCEPAIEAYETQGPDGKAFHFIPQSANRLSEIAIQPFPFRTMALELSVTARRISARRYTSDADLHAVLQTAKAELLNWTLVPA